MGSRPLPTALLAAAMAAGCASLGETPGAFGVASEPAGADVYVMGKKVGVTPLVVQQSAVFPLTYPPAQQALYGLVELRKAGCKTVSIPVSVRALASGMRVTLDCGEASPTKAATPPAPAPVQQSTPPPPAPLGEPSPAPAAASLPAPATEARPAAAVAEPLRKPLSPTSAAIEERLRRVQELHDRGVITEKEAQAARQRILGEL